MSLLPDKNGIVNSLADGVSSVNGAWGKSSVHLLSVTDIENVCKQAGFQFRQCDKNGGVLYFQADKN